MNQKVNKEIQDFILNFDPETREFEEIFKKYSWTEFLNSFTDVLTREPDKIFSLSERLLFGIYFYFGFEKFLDTMNLIIEHERDERYIHVLGKLIDAFHSESGFYQYDAIKVMNLMYEIDEIAMVPYLAKYAVDFIYADAYHFLGDDSEEFRFDATTMLAELRSLQAESALIKVLEEEGVSERIILTAIRGLQNCASEKSLPILYRFAFGYWCFDCCSCYCNNIYSFKSLESIRTV
ncbi:MAG: HEAT repeat domain-containing protein [Candidatus Heimdallarchaeota archaeon]